MGERELHLYGIARDIDTITPAEAARRAQWLAGVIVSLEFVRECFLAKAQNETPPAPILDGGEG